MSASDLQLVESAPLRFLLRLPRTDRASAGAGPVLCFLHGYDEAAPLEIQRGLTRHGPLRRGSSTHAAHDFIVVAPQLPMAGDLWSRYADAVQEIVQEVQHHHRGDRRRTYLTGFSFGGNGVFDLALKQRDLWAALWAVDPTRVPAEDPQLPIWLSSGQVSRRRKAGFIERLRLKTVESAPAGDRIYVDQGQDHVGTAALAYRDERIYRWLLSKKRA